MAMRRRPLFCRVARFAWRDARPARHRLCPVADQHGFIVGQGIQGLIVARDERLLRRFGALARDRVGLGACEKAMRARDRPTLPGLENSIRRREAKRF